MAGPTIARSARKNWTDLGVYTLTFYGYISPNGKLTVQSYVVYINRHNAAANKKQSR
jgi:hypothetical protein